METSSFEMFDLGFETWSVMLMQSRHEIDRPIIKKNFQILKILSNYWQI